MLLVRGLTEKWKAWFFILVFLVPACTSATQKLNEYALDLGFERFVVKGDQFSHVVFQRPSDIRSGILHVYLDGDGTPWLRERYVTRDPTPRNPLVLRLMSLDTTASIYLGRPCYHGFSTSDICDPKYWTTDRYSELVVHSMETALREIISEYDYNQLIFIGYSGGGTFAMLLAGRFATTYAVLTLAANLDPESWTLYHNYTPLYGSISPFHLPKLAANIIQLHLVGENDTNIPPWMTYMALKNQKTADIRVIEKFDHQCCWEKIWGNILASLETTAIKENRIWKKPLTKKP